MYLQRGKQMNNDNGCGLAASCLFAFHPGIRRDRELVGAVKRVMAMADLVARLDMGRCLHNAGGIRQVQRMILRTAASPSTKANFLPSGSKHEPGLQMSRPSNARAQNCVEQRRHGNAKPH
jgi:hypothetical protein